MKTIYLVLLFSQFLAHLDIVPLSHGLEQTKWSYQWKYCYMLTMPSCHTTERSSYSMVCATVHVIPSQDSLVLEHHQRVRQRSVQWFALEQFAPGLNGQCLIHQPCWKKNITSSEGEAEDVGVTRTVSNASAMLKEKYYQYYTIKLPNLVWTCQTNTLLSCNPILGWFFLRKIIIMSNVTIRI